MKYFVLKRNETCIWFECILIIDILKNINLLSPVSNEVPEHPCVSPVSNQVFERRLIEKYIAENGVDPINGQPLSEEQLIDIKGTAAQMTLFSWEVQMLYGHFKMHPFLYF